MVLQRDKPIPIWGHAAPSEQITVQLGAESAQTTADAKGYWIIDLKPLPAGGPYTLSVKGANVINISNVDMGDVWLCAGQSNMSIKVKYSDFDAKDIASANVPAVRYFKSDKILSHTAQSTLPGSWLVFSPQTVPEFSAIAFHFGKQMFAETHVPIGLIDLSYGGAPIESFLTDEPLIKSASAAGQFFPAAVRNGMILPVAHLRAKGVLWYQGESNIFEANRYLALLMKLIADWRALFQDPNLPFFVVQLPNVGRRDAIPSPISYFAELRASQAKSANIPNVFVTINIDTNPGAIVDMHSHYKRVVAQRLAQAVTAIAYGVKLPIKYPTFEAAQEIKNQYLLSFRDTAQGLKTVGTHVRGFTIANAKGVFFPAIAFIAPDRKHILVWNPAVPNPTAVRYAWADNPEANVYNSDNFPLTPFATDRP
jgi:sialate O-acetylesterase